MILAQEEYRTLAQDPAKQFWKDVTLYVTIEPCVMCASALRQLGNRRTTSTESSLGTWIHDNGYERLRLISCLQV
jgi:tRNA(Arg) A34 adenosine deaminase TadA